MLKRFIIFIMIISLFCQSKAFAKNKTDADIINQYNKFYKICCDKFELGYSFDYDNQILTLIDISLNILKKPEYAFEAIMSFPRDLYFTPKLIKKYKYFKEKYLKTLDDPNTDSAEKLLFMALTLMFPIESEGDPLADFSEKRALCVEGLKTMKNKCDNKDFAALATALLFEEGNHDYYQEFIDNFPNHPSIPDIKLCKISPTFFKCDYQTCINETIKIIDEYGTQVGPNGWTFDINCYEFLISCYLKLDNHAKAYKYYKLIREKAPNNPIIPSMKSTFETAPTINIKK